MTTGEPDWKALALDLAGDLWSAEDQWGSDYLWTKWNLSRLLTPDHKAMVMADSDKPSQTPPIGPS